MNSAVGHRSFLFVLCAGSQGVLFATERRCRPLRFPGEERRSNDQQLTRGSYPYLIIIIEFHGGTLPKSVVVP